MNEREKQIAQLSLGLADDAPKVPTPAEQERIALEGRWVELTNRLLPRASGSEGWPIHLNHCFQRVLLDHACGGVWYDHIDGRPAYRHAPEAILERAVAAGEACLTGNADLPAMNQQSLIWRGKSGPQQAPERR